MTRASSDSNGPRIGAAALAVAALLLLSGCTLVDERDIDAVRNGPAPTAPLAAELKAQYLALAAAEAAEMDYFDANLFLGKARRAAAGEAVGPQPLTQRYLAPAAERELAGARATVVDLNHGRAPREAPRDVARAQAMFDCWLQEQEEDRQPADIAACRDGFHAAVAAARENSALGEDLFVVIPGDDGEVGAIRVSSGDREVVLDRANAAAHIQPARGLEPVALEAGEIEEAFATALAARPIAPASFQLYFRRDSLDLTPASAPELPRVHEEIARREVAEVTVIGHTDRVGRSSYNDRLSLERAEEVRRFLVDKGIAAAMITVAGRGEREPLVATADGVEEARNRRVEISVR
jgi:OOP family OmpA-OmpF porin